MEGQGAERKGRGDDCHVLFGWLNASHLVKRRHSRLRLFCW